MTTHCGEGGGNEFFGRAERKIERGDFVQAAQIFFDPGEFFLQREFGETRDGGMGGYTGFAWRSEKAQVHVIVGVEFKAGKSDEAAANLQFFREVAEVP